MTPHELEVAALKALVGEAQLGASAAVELLNASEVSADDCSSAPVKALWSVVESRLRAGEILDSVSIAKACPGVPRSLVVEVLTDYALGVGSQRLPLVKNASLRRKYLEVLRATARVLADEKQGLEAAKVEAAKLLSQWALESKKTETLDASVHPFVDLLEAVQRGEKEPTLQTGLDAWDALCGGLPPTLTVVGALPGVGKSMLVAGLCRNLGRRGVPVGLLSLEDEREWVVQRLMSEAAQVPLFLLANTPLSQEQLARVGESAPGVYAALGKVICDDRSGLTTAEVVASARHMIGRGAKAILLDHLGEIRLERSERHDLDIAEALAELRRLAKAHRVPVVVVAHLRRREGLGPFDKPRLTDFAFSAGVERMARLAVGLYREKDDDSVLHVAVLKQTRGRAFVEFDLRTAPASAVVIHSPASERSPYT